MFGPARRTWVLGGGGARGAAQVGVLQALFEANLEAPVAIVGTSVGALNGASIAAYPSLAGTMMLREVWMSRPALSVFQAHPLGLLVSGIRRYQLSAFPQENVRRLIDRAQALTGVTTFEQLRVPLAVVATDLNAGKPAVFRSGALTPALLASTAIPGVFPMVNVNGRQHLDGGVIENTPLNTAVEDGAREILAISLMAGGEQEETPAGFGELIARTLQLSLHHQMLTDFERLRGRCRIVVICPVTAPTATWEMKREHLESVMDKSRSAMAHLLHERGSRLFRHSAIHYLRLG
ncbi:MAG TPA: patatin-like phospholipase family protein [Candidatus Dormibacteraeota bacterium]|jgi:NTE family protein|nr:patatin-like phospholipase family protein [Candidatus Dormibacteraeota bacterium]